MKKLVAHFALLVAGILVQDATHTALRVVRERTLKRKEKKRRDGYFG